MFVYEKETISHYKAGDAYTFDDAFAWHTGCNIGYGVRINLQIRTYKMHDIAELGVAAHWRYKQGHNDSLDTKQYVWIRELLSILEQNNDPETFLQNTKLAMYYDQVFCFTPKGQLIALPKGATLI